MKLLIARLDGTLIASAIYQPKIKKDDDAVSNSSESDIIVDDRSQKIIGQLKLNDNIKAVINHSRTLSLSLYENQLIYAKLQGVSYYYRAKYNLLFLVVQQAKQSINLTISSIDNIILKIIKQYETTCEKIGFNYKLPRNITNYQKSILQNMSFELIEIVIEEKSIQMDMREIKIESSIGQEQLRLQLDKRIKDLSQIQSKSRKIKRQPSLFQRYTINNLKKYKIKLCFMSCLIVFMILAFGIIIYYTSPEEILI